MAKTVGFTIVNGEVVPEDGEGASVEEIKAALRKYGWLRDDGDGRGEVMHNTRPDCPGVEGEE